MGETSATRSKRGKKAWTRLSPEDQAARIAPHTDWYRRNKPWRTPLYESMKAAHPDRQPCIDCGGDGRMQLAFDDEAQTVEFVAWRCYPCRKVLSMSVMC